MSRKATVWVILGDLNWKDRACVRHAISNAVWDFYFSRGEISAQILGRS